MRKLLRILCDLTISYDYQKNKYDFYSLNWAYEDLEFKDVQHYWPEANKSNIEKIVLDRCKEWIEDYNKKAR